MPHKGIPCLLRPHWLRGNPKASAHLAPGYVKGVLLAWKRGIGASADFALEFDAGAWRVPHAAVIQNKSKQRELPSYAIGEGGYGDGVCKTWDRGLPCGELVPKGGIALPSCFSAAKEGYKAIYVYTFNLDRLLGCMIVVNRFLLAFWLLSKG